MKKFSAAAKIVVGAFLGAALLIHCDFSWGIHRAEGGTSGAIGFTIPARDAVSLEQTSIRNATNKTIEYTFRPHGSNAASMERRLDPMAVHAFPDSTALDVTFSRSHARITYKIKPGRPYVFRHNEQGELELYAGSHGKPPISSMFTENKQ